MPRASRSRTTAVQSVALPAPRRRRRRSDGPSKADLERLLEEANRLKNKANARARDARRGAEKALGEARNMDLVWSVGESMASMTGAVAGSTVQGVADYYLADDYDKLIAAGLIGTGLAVGVASLAVGYAVHPRIGTVGMAWSTGWSMPGVIELSRSGTEFILEQVMSATEAA